MPRRLPTPSSRQSTSLHCNAASDPFLRSDGRPRPPTKGSRAEESDAEESTTALATSSLPSRRAASRRHGNRVHKQSQLLLRRTRAERGAGKRTAYEETIRKCTARPLSAAPAVGSQMVLSIDLAPTLLEMAGLSPGPHLQGRSLVPPVSGAPADWRQTIQSSSLSRHGLPRVLNIRVLGGADGEGKVHWGPAECRGSDGAVRYLEGQSLRRAQPESTLRMPLRCVPACRPSSPGCSRPPQHPATRRPRADGGATWASQPPRLREPTLEIASSAARIAGLTPGETRHSANGRSWRGLSSRPASRFACSRPTRCSQGGADRTPQAAPWVLGTARPLGRWRVTRDAGSRRPDAAAEAACGARASLESGRWEIRQPLRRAPAGRV